MLHIAIHIEPLGVQFTVDFVKPAVAIGRPRDQFGVPTQRRIVAGEHAASGANYIRHRLEALDPSEDLPRVDRPLRCGVEVVIDNFAEQPSRKGGESNAQPVVLQLFSPIMSAGITISDGQMGDKTRLLVKEGLGRGSHSASKVNREPWGLKEY